LEKSNIATMNNKTTLVIAAVVFVLVGTLVFAAIAPYLSTVNAAPPVTARGCNIHSPDGGDGNPANDRLKKGCGPN
jgi:hypothetical protein